MESLNSSAEIYDLEGTICLPEEESSKINSRGSNILDIFTYQFYDQVDSRKERAKLSFMALYLTGVKKFTKRVLPWRFEETVLPLYEETFLSKYNPPIDLAHKVGEECAGLIPDRAVELLENKEKEVDKYIVTTGTPRSMVLRMLEEKGIKDLFQEIYANEFQVKDGGIVGFNPETFFMGRKGKRAKAKEIASKGYSMISAIGDTYADLGLFDIVKDTGGKMCTSSDAHSRVRKEVRSAKHGGILTKMTDALSLETT